MKIIQLIFFYLAIILLAMVLSLSGVRLSFSLGIFAVLAVAMIYRHIHILYRTNNMELVDKWVKRRRKEPIFAALYASAYGTLEEQIRAFDVIIHQYKQPAIKYNYQFMKAIMEENHGAAKAAAQQINKEPLSSYAFCYLAALEGRTVAMRSDKLTQSWMQPAIEAVYAHTQKDQALFRQWADASIEQARGVQKYGLIHNFRQMEKDWGSE
ncbi:hypothetical protein [Lysinibacillus sp. ZYM-1]|uniref:hypothetical protein n=1 Tax=Lysinibacillus sp. ZYM-1 TaxID=1681184 RepID=UPI0006CE94AF|nr:hypothetical protein [Lysinibacillus sp. ZYM-1]KPN94720.1 hypothetical protein AO843_04265 [Lysinibacillus sp. ZYM-1]